MPKDIACHCDYCKDPIHVGDPKVTEDERNYHVDCFNQSKTFYDPFEQDEDTEEESDD